jgi:hypothetical protein
VFARRERLTRIDRHLDRGDELMESIRDELRLTRAMQGRHHEEIRREFELNRREHELNRREHQETRAALQSLRDAAEPSSYRSRRTPGRCGNCGARFVPKPSVS